MSKKYNGICPCKDCDQRTSICHSHCTDYKNWVSSAVEIKNEETFNPYKYKYSKKWKRNWKEF